MGIVVAVVRATASTSGGTQDITTTALGGLTPKAALFIMPRTETDASATNHAHLGIGATDGTSQWSTTVMMRNGQTTADVYSRSANTRVFQILNTTTGAISGDAEFSAWITNGVRINWTDSITTAQLFTVIFFAGSDLSAKVGTVSASSTDQAEVTTTTTFQPTDVLFSALGHTAWNNTSDAGAAPQLGMAHNGGSIAQAVVAHQSTDASSGSVTDGALYTTRIGAILASGALSRSYELSAFLSDGFKVKTHGSGAQIFGYLALNYGGKANSYVGTVASPTSTGSTANTAPGIDTQFVMLAASHLSATGTIQSTSTNSLALGVSAITDSLASAVAIADEDGSATTDAQNITDDLPLLLPLPDGTNGLVTSTYSLDSNGYTLNYTTVQGTGRYMAVWAISVEITGTAYDQAVAGTLTSAGATVKQTTKKVAGALTSAGSLVRATAKAVAGALTTTGAVAKRTAKSFAGALTSVGAVLASRIIAVLLAGTLGLSGGLIRQATKAVGGTLASAGGIVKAITKKVAGTLTSAGALGAVRTYLKALAGTLTSTGALSRRTGKAVSGALASAGGIVRTITKKVAGILTSTGAIAAQRVGAPVAAFALTLGRRHRALHVSERGRAFTVRARRALNLRSRS